MIKEEITKEDLMCVACENTGCDFFTIFKGCLLCSYCLEDWFKEKGKNFDDWMILQREIIRKDRMGLNEEEKA